MKMGLTTNKVDLTARLSSYERIEAYRKKLTRSELQKLLEWEKCYVTGSGEYATSDWPGWKNVFQRLDN